VNRAATWIATLFGAGFFPFAPATFASLLVAILLFLIGGAPWFARAAALAGVIAIGVWAADRAERSYGHDAHCIVIDEVAGMLTAALIAPWTWSHLAAAFLLFRAFDILKPPPVYQLQSLRGGWGVMADDLAAGVFSLAILSFAQIIWPRF
jgi:phosphatidylglycerophosphatase A